MAEIQTHEAWGEWHSTLFGFGPAQIPMVLIWVEEFKTCGYSIAELVAATRSFRADAPQFANAHYGALHTFVQRKRADERARFASEMTKRAANSGGSNCCACGDSGWVVVPHAKYVADWVDAARFVTAAVACRCYVGRMVIENWNPKTTPPVTMDDYERQVPNWRELEKFHKDILTAKARTANVNAALGKAVDQVLAKVKPAEEA